MVVAAHVVDVEALIYKLPGVDRLAVVEAELSFHGSLSSCPEMNRL